MTFTRIVPESSQAQSVRIGHDRSSEGGGVGLTGQSMADQGPKKTPPPLDHTVSQKGETHRNPPAVIWGREGKKQAQAQTQARLESVLGIPSIVFHSSAEELNLRHLG